MPKITVYPFTYLDSENGIRIRGAGMCTEETILNMKKDPEIIRSEAKVIDDFELSQSGRYHENNSEGVEMT